jgi:hypothetical protein
VAVVGLLYHVWLHGGGLAAGEDGVQGLENLPVFCALVEFLRIHVVTC